MKLAFLVSGRGTNLKALISACRSGQVQAEPALVISDRPQAGALQVAESAAVANLLINAHDYGSRSEHERAIVKELDRHGIGLVILAGYQRLLSPFLVGYLYEPRLGQSRILNIHPADGIRAHEDRYTAAALALGRVELHQRVVQRHPPRLRRENGHA